MTTRPAIAQATAGFPASDAWWLSQVYNPINWLYGQQPLIALKAADTSRSSNVTTSPDPELQVTVLASTTYLVEMFIAYVADATMDFQCDYSAPSGASGIMSPWGPDLSATSGSTTTTIRTVADASVTSARGVGGSDGSIILTARPVGTLITGASGGTFSFDWAQNTSSATAATVKAGSWIKLTPKA